ncbi:MAG TPA: class I SAM-dependent methyltransferase [Candidatus Eisenbacteria bacterium]
MTAGTCIVCDAQAWSPLYRGLVRCERCGFVRAAEIPGPGEVARLYGPEYFRGEEYADYLGDEPVHLENFRRRLERIEAVAGRLESIYEIGCAYGLWLRVAAGRGIRAAGIDISPEAVRHAATELGLDARLGAFEDAPLTPGAFQAYCLWDTLEHLPHPEAYVAKIATLLPPGGWLFLTTGDIGSPLARRERERWRMIHPPTHLQYFSRETLARFLARHGLRVTHVESTPMCRSVHGTLEGLKRFGAEPLRTFARVAARLVPRPLAIRMRFSVDLGDILLACARRENSAGALSEI